MDPSSSLLVNVVCEWPLFRLKDSHDDDKLDKIITKAQIMFLLHFEENVAVR